MTARDPLKVQKALKEAYLKKSAISKLYLRKQLRILRLVDYKDIRTLIQKCKDLIYIYNKIARSIKLKNTIELNIDKKDKIAIVEAIDLIYKNLFKD